MLTIIKAISHIILLGYLLNNLSKHKEAAECLQKAV